MTEHVDSGGGPSMGHEDASLERRHSSRNGGRRTSASESASRQRDGHVGWLKVGIPLAVLLLLTVFAAGKVDGMLLAAGALAVLGVAVCRPPLRKSARIFWWLGIATFLWLLVTLVPLPLANLGADHVRFFGEMESVLADSPLQHAERGASTGRWTAEDSQAAAAESLVCGRLSLNRSGTHRFIVLLGLGWGMLWMCSSMSATERRTFLRIVLLGGTAVAVLGLLGRFVFPTGRHVWWVIEMNHNVGGQPFVNRNHFASFCAMLVPLGLCLTLAPGLKIPGKRRSSSRGSHSTSEITKPHREHDRGSSAEPRASRGKAGGANGGPVLLHWVFGICLLILVSAVILSLSRGGMLAMVVGALAAAAFWLRGHPVLATGATVAVVAAIFAFVFWPNQEVQRRVQSLSDLETASPLRNQLRDEAMSQWRDYPVIGGGAESFRVLYGLYRSRPGTVSPEYAENEYVQLLADLGVLGAILAILLAGVYLGCVYGGLKRESSDGRHKSGILGGHVWVRARHRKGRDEVFSVLAAVAVGTCVVLLFHSAVDFPARVPLNAALAGALLGMGISMPERSRQRRRSFWWPRTLTYALGMTACIAGGVKWGIRLDEPSHLREASVPELKMAIESAPSYWYPWYQMARAYMSEAKSLASEELSPESAARQIELWNVSIACFEAAAAYNPLHFEIQYELARAKFRMAGRMTDEVRNAFRRAARLAPEEDSVWREWVQIESGSGGPDSAWQVAETAEELASNAQALKVWKRILRQYEEQESLAKAYEAILNITRLAPKDFAMLRKRSRLELRMGMTSAAVMSITKATELRPEDHQLWMQLGKLELKRGNDLRANEAFTRAMRIKPGLREEVDEIWAEQRGRGSEKTEPGGSLFEF